MSFKFTSSSGISNLPTVEQVKAWSRDNVKTFLQGLRIKLDLEDEDINKIYNQKVRGSTFLDFIAEDFERWGVPGSPAKEIEKLINEIKGEQPVAGRVRAHSDEDFDTAKRRKTLEEYRTTVARGLEGNSPSVGANPENFFKTQETDPILNGRPLHNTGPPITLYNKVFSKFLDDFNNVNLEIPSDFLSWTEELILAATNSYGDEEERNEAIRGKFSEKFGTILLIEYGKKKQKCKSDGMFVTEVNLINAYLGILEGKNEIGMAKNDPTIQGAIYYRDYWSQKNVDQIRDFCCAPSFIIGMAGPWFCILGGVFLSRAVIQPLTDFIPLTINLRISDQVKRISRLFYSLLLAIKELKEFYKNLKQEETEQRFFPYIRQYKTGDIVHRFTYLCALLDDHTRTIWKAMREDGVLIVVKFASKYNIQGHIICANNNLAPQLLYSSDDEETKALGGFKMIIMEYICGTPLDQKYLEIKPESSIPIIGDVQLAVELLHSANLVFGDLRAPNVLIVDTHGSQRAVLVDFDWCGQHELDRYPSSMNKELQWPLGAEPCALLKKEHDIYWINSLLTDYLSFYTYKIPSESGMSSGSGMSSVDLL